MLRTFDMRALIDVSIYSQNLFWLIPSNSTINRCFQRTLQENSSKMLIWQAATEKHISFILFPLNNGKTFVVYCLITQFINLYNLQTFLLFVLNKHWFQLPQHGTQHKTAQFTKHSNELRQNSLINYAGQGRYDRSHKHFYIYLYI